MEQYIQDKLDEFDEIVELTIELIEGGAVINKNDLKMAIKEKLKSIFTYYHNHIVDKYENDIKLLKLIHKQELDSIALKSLEEFMNWSVYRKSLQDTNK